MLNIFLVISSFLPSDPDVAIHVVLFIQHFRQKDATEHFKELITIHAVQTNYSYVLFRLIL